MRINRGRITREKLFILFVCLGCFVFVLALHQIGLLKKDKADSITNPLPIVETKSVLDVFNKTTEESRLDTIRQSMMHVWSNYKDRAYGADELLPISGKSRQNWGHSACTLIDALDTLWIMNLTSEFNQATEYLTHNFSYTAFQNTTDYVSIFELIIRNVGGLLSAFELSHESIYKEKAIELVEILLPAFHKEKGVFYTQFNPSTKGNHPSNRELSSIAELGSMQLEFRYLSDITGNPTYAAMGNAWHILVNNSVSYNNTGLFPTLFNVETGKFASDDNYISMGASSDSFYEYLLKVWLYSGRREEDTWLRTLYDAAMEGMMTYLVQVSSDHATYLSSMEIPSGAIIPEMEHLSCFVPGMLTLGIRDDSNKERRDKYLKVARQLTTTCYEMYDTQVTGLGPERVKFPGYVPSPRYHILRPETVESLFYLYRSTGDETYQRWGWDIFRSLERHCKTQYGYASIADVTQRIPKLEDKMESFFLAETLKYHYLLQSPTSVLPLDQYVFTTEAHPLRLRPFQQV